MGKHKSNKDSRPDFLRDKDDRIEKVSAKDIWSAITLQHPPTRKVVGFFMIVMSVLMAIGFISFLFTGQRDQNHPAGNIHNAMGYFGWALSSFFIEKGFGLAAFAFLPWITFSGLYLLFDYRPFSLLRMAIHTLLFSVWLSLSLTFIMGWFERGWFPTGGVFGASAIIQIQEAIGTVGTISLLVFYAIAYSIFFFNANPFSKIKFNTQEDLEEDLILDDSQLSSIIPETDKTVDTGFEPTIVEDFEADKIDTDLVEVELCDDDIDLTPAEKQALSNISIKSVSPKDESISAASSAIQNGEPVPFFDDDADGFDDAKTHSFNFAPTSNSEASVSGINTLLGDDGFKVEVMNSNPEEGVEENLGDNSIARMGLDTQYDPTAELSKYVFPTLDLLQEYDTKKQEVDMDEITASKDLILETLINYKIGIAHIKASVGPTITLYEIVPAPGVKISRIKNLEDDIALSLAALGIRIIAPIPGKGTIGIEVPNKNPEMVPIRSLLSSKQFQDCDFQLPVVLGKTISNDIYIADLAKMPHLLMAGATGQGKSVGLNAILISLLYKKHPAYIKFVLVDPKKVELTLFNKIERHYLAKLPGDGEAIITDNHKVVNTLNSLCLEMDNRYKLLQDALVRNILEYNTKFLARKLNPNEGHRFLPYIVVVMDEVADLIMTAGKEIEIPIARLAQLARAIGIHLILATQRPSVNVITGMIKANFPARIAFRVSSKIDSRTILDSNGADQLIGRGDMLYSGGSEVIRLQCPFVDTPEVERIVDFIGEQRGFSSAYLLPELKEEGGFLSGDGFDSDQRDPIFEDAARVVVLNQVGSTSMIQRKLKIGYNRAGRLMDQLEDAGVVGPNNGSKARQVLIPDEFSLEQFLNNL